MTSRINQPGTPLEEYAAFAAPTALPKPLRAVHSDALSIPRRNGVVPLCADDYDLTPVPRALRPIALASPFGQTSPLGLSPLPAPLWRRSWASCDFDTPPALSPLKRRPLNEDAVADRLASLELCTRMSAERQASVDLSPPPSPQARRSRCALDQLLPEKISQDSATKLPRARRARCDAAPP